MVAKSVWLLVVTVAGIAWAASPRLDERPAAPGEWGYRPDGGEVLAVTPPAFCWRPTKGVVSWELECSRDAQFRKVVYRNSGIGMHVHCPPRVFSSGRYWWRYRGVTASGEKTNWSRLRHFQVSPQARELPLPEKDELLARIPRSHPRLFLRPEDLPRLRQLARGRLKRNYEELVAQCERWLADPPSTEEPPKYGPEIVANSDAWREIWWGNREYTIKTLNAAATLAFTRLLDGNERYGREAKRILLECARWDPHGSTGYRYNDEAGMPYAYYFARTYTFVYDLLDEKEREICRRVMKARGDEMYRHLYPRHLWRPYSSHSNRAWHFLGELGIAGLGEVEGAEDWVWFAMNVFHCVYPVWSDDDGGWHEGFGYWNSYIGRFTWWADVMRAAMGVNAYDKPYFSQAGYYPMYLLPPGKIGAGFGDLNAKQRSSRAVPLVSQLAAQSGNRHWQWYVEQMGGPAAAPGYIGFIRGSLPRVRPQAPSDLPSSRLFRGIGQAFLNTTITNADDDVQVVFKSSPFGTQSHGYEANNSFLLWAYGKRLLIRSGYRDSYGTPHHRDWMWSTRSVNNITVNGAGQRKHSAASQGCIVAFETSESIDMVAGEAGAAYRDADGRPLLDRYTRTIFFVKPELILVFDRLQAREPSTYEYWLHATDRFRAAEPREISLRIDDVGCDIAILRPVGLKLSQTNQYDPNPRPRIKLREWHLTAATQEKRRSVEFVTVIRPYRVAERVGGRQQIVEKKGGYVLEATLADGGRIMALLPRTDDASLSQGDYSTVGRCVVRRWNADGKIVSTVTATALIGSRPKVD